jgi:hypothetical protein
VGEQGRFEMMETASEQPTQKPAPHGFSVKRLVILLFPYFGNFFVFMVAWGASCYIVEEVFKIVSIPWAMCFGFWAANISFWIGSKVFKI